MSIKQLQRTTIDADFHGYTAKEIEFIVAPSKPGAGYWLAMATMVSIVFSVVFYLV